MDKHPPVKRNLNRRVFGIYNRRFSEARLDAIMNERSHGLAASALNKVPIYYLDQILRALDLHFNGLPLVSYLALNSISARSVKDVMDMASKGQISDIQLSLKEAQPLAFLMHSNCGGKTDWQRIADLLVEVDKVVRCAIYDFFQHVLGANLDEVLSDEGTLSLVHPVRSESGLKIRTINGSPFVTDPESRSELREDIFHQKYLVEATVAADDDSGYERRLFVGNAGTLAGAFESALTAFERERSKNASGEVRWTSLAVVHDRAEYMRGYPRLSQEGVCEIRWPDYAVTADAVREVESNLVQLKQQFHAKRLEGNWSAIDELKREIYFQEKRLPDPDIPAAAIQNALSSVRSGAYS